MASLLGEPMFAGMRRIGFDSPIKALSFEFLNMLEVEQVFDMTCLVTGIRTRTFDVAITGRRVDDPAGALFIARVTPITVSRTERRSIEIPEALRRPLEQYRQKTK